MKIFNVRLGLATNSSSNHGVVLFSRDNRPADTIHIEDGEWSFGWDNWTATSDEAKMAYFALQVRSNLSKLLPPQVVDIVADHLVGPVMGDIDHGSVFRLPRSYGTQFLDMEFIEDLKSFFMRPNVGIIGGNDNQGEDEHHPLLGQAIHFPLSRDSSAETIVRRDPQFNFWTIFRPENGTKIRFSFNDLDVAPQRASTPELVDLKITNLCNSNCPYCYQDSNPNGAHATIRWIEELIYNLHGMKVFEIALGGGDPTLYPYFRTVLSSCRYYDIVPNFSTRNLSWLHDPELRPEIIENCGSFAFSAQKPREIGELIRIIDYFGIPHSKVAIHLVMGTLDEWDFKNCLRMAGEGNLATVLLGWKRYGRAAGQEPPKPYREWLRQSINEVEPDGPSTISFDTILVEEMRSQLEDINPVLYSLGEGKFSCYIDAVSKKMAPSSYSDENIHQLPDSLDYRSGGELARIFNLFG